MQAERISNGIEQLLFEIFEARRASVINRVTSHLSLIAIFFDSIDFLRLVTFRQQRILTVHFALYYNEDLFHERAFREFHHAFLTYYSDLSGAHIIMARYSFSRSRLKRRRLELNVFRFDCRQLCYKRLYERRRKTAGVDEGREDGGEKSEWKKSERTAAKAKYVRRFERNRDIAVDRWRE